jgi:hypothetical protein
MIFCLTLLYSTQLFGHEWSDEQLEVWKAVENLWEVSTKGTLADVEGLVHDDYRGWNNIDPLPYDKEKWKKYRSYYEDKSKITFYDIDPVAIDIFEKMAIVHYFHYFVVKTGEDEENERTGHQINIMMKEGDKWLIIGSFNYMPETN